MSGPRDPMSSRSEWVRRVKDGTPSAVAPRVVRWDGGNHTPPSRAPAPERDLAGYGVACVSRVSLAATLKRVASVSADFAHIEHHEIVRVAGLTTHYVRLIGGGTLHYAYNHRGQLVEIDVNGVFVAVTKDRRVTVRPLVRSDL